MVKMLNEEELKIAYVNREKINNELRKKIDNTNCSIISSNCIGGMIYHDLGFEFLSPTINMYFNSKDFSKLVINIEKYMSISPEVLKNEPFPILLLEDIKLFCLHYKTYVEAVQSWERRKKRINYDNIFVIATDRNCENKEDLKKIDRCDYDKVIFVSNEDHELENGIYVTGYQGQVGHLDRFVDESGYREYEKYLQLNRVFKQR